MTDEKPLIRFIERGSIGSIEVMRCPKCGEFHSCEKVRPYKRTNLKHNQLSQVYRCYGCLQEFELPKKKEEVFRYDL